MCYQFQNVNTAMNLLMGSSFSYSVPLYLYVYALFIQSEPLKEQGWLRILFHRIHISESERFSFYHPLFSSASFLSLPGVSAAPAILRAVSEGELQGIARDG